MRFPLIFTSGRNTIESIVPAAAITDNTIAVVIISSSNEKALYSHFEKFATIIAYYVLFSLRFFMIVEKRRFVVYDAGVLSCRSRVISVHHFRHVFG